MKTLILFFSLIFFLHVNVMSQFCLDGSYCPISSEPPGNGCIPSATDEYGNSQFEVVDPAPSSTCELGTMFADIDVSDGSNPTLFIGFTHGNGGNAFFRFYFNTDCDNTTGALTDFERGTSGPTANVGGAEIRVTIQGNGTLNSIDDWNSGTSSWDPKGHSGNSLPGDSDGCGGTDSDFIEAAIPIVPDLNFDPCGPTDCNGIELTTSLANSGGSPTSQFCQSSGIAIVLPINSPPEPLFNIPDTVCQDDLGIFPTFFLDASGTIDADLGTAEPPDSLDYTWSSSLEASTAFSNPNGTGVVDVNNISTSYTPTVAGIHQISLTVSDRFDCDSTAAGVEYQVTVLPNTDIYCISLPVTLLHFDCEWQDDNSVMLNWSTASEEDNSHFEIQYSLDGLTWFYLNAVEGNGTTNTTMNYNYLHTNVLALQANTIFYRLKQIDFNGNYAFSDIELVQITPSTTNSVDVFPNSVQHGQSMVVTTRSKNIGQIVVYNAIGMMMSDVHLSRIGKTTTLNTSNLTTGFYIVVVYDLKGKLVGQSRFAVW